MCVRESPGSNDSRYFEVGLPIYLFWVGNEFPTMVRSLLGQPKCKSFWPHLDLIPFSVFPLESQAKCWAPIFPTISFSSLFVYLSLSLSLSQIFQPPFHCPFHYLWPSLNGFAIISGGFPPKWRALFWPRFLIRWDPSHISKLTRLEIVLASKCMLSEQISPRHYMVFSVMSQISLYCTILGAPIWWESQSIQGSIACSNWAYY